MEMSSTHVFDKLSADDPDHRRAFVRQESQRNLGQAGLPAFSGGVDPVVIARTERRWGLGQRRQPHRPKPLPIGRPDPRYLHQPDPSKDRMFERPQFGTTEATRHDRASLPQRGR